jgi:hypothetical protein
MREENKRKNLDDRRDAAFIIRRRNDGADLLKRRRGKEDAPSKP